MAERGTAPLTRGPSLAGAALTEEAIRGKVENRADFGEPGPLGRTEATVGVADRKRDARDQIGQLAILGDASEFAEQHPARGFGIVAQLGQEAVENPHDLVRVVDPEPFQAREDTVDAVSLGKRDLAVGLCDERAGRHGGVQEIVVPVTRDALAKSV